LDDAITTRKTTASNQAMQELAGVTSEDQVASTLAGLGIDPKDITADAMAAIMGSQGRAMGFDSERLTQEGTRASTRGTNARTANTTSAGERATTDFNRRIASEDQLKGVAGEIVALHSDAWKGGTTVEQPQPTQPTVAPEDRRTDDGYRDMSPSAPAVPAPQATLRSLADLASVDGNAVMPQTFIDFQDDNAENLNTGNVNRDADRERDSAAEIAAYNQARVELADTKTDREAELAVNDQLVTDGAIKQVNEDWQNFGSRDALLSSYVNDTSLSNRQRNALRAAANNLPESTFTLDNPAPDSINPAVSTAIDQTENADAAFASGNPTLRVVNEAETLGESSQPVVDLINTSKLSMSPDEVLRDVAVLREALSQEGITASNNELLVILRDTVDRTGFMEGLIPGGGEAGGDIRFNTDAALTAAKEVFSPQGRASAVEVENSLESRATELSGLEAAVRELEKENALTVQRGGEVSMGDQGKLNIANQNLEDYVKNRAPLGTPSNSNGGNGNGGGPDVSNLGLTAGSGFSWPENIAERFGGEDNLVPQNSSDPVLPNDAISGDGAYDEGLRYIGSQSEEALALLQDPSVPVEQKLVMLDNAIYQILTDQSLDPFAKRTLQMQFESMEEALNNQ
jgi:hypothetical protein